MKIKVKGTLAIPVILLGILVAFSPSSSWGQQGEMLPLVSLTGTIYSIDKEGVTGGLAYMHIAIEKKTLNFNVTKAKSLGNASLLESDIINSIVPPFLNIFGSSKDLAPLLQPDIVGKVVTIEGNLDSVGHFLQATKITIGK